MSIHVINLSYMETTEILDIESNHVMEANLSYFGKGTGFETQLYLVDQIYGFDFTAYNWSTVIPQVFMRMRANSIESLEEYMDHLLTHSDEFALLFDAILVHITAFFRDVGEWDALSEEVLPRIISGKRSNEPIRVWSAGCSSGEEVYTLAILLAEALGMDAFRKNVRIFATDIDGEALAKGRRAVYSEKAVAAIPEELRSKYFNKVINSYVVRSELRDRVVFGRHDLFQDPPFSNIDLISCRNTLMFFKSKAQDRIFAGFHFALKNTGFLFLGKSETVLKHVGLFRSVNSKNRIYLKLPAGTSKVHWTDWIRNGEFKDAKDQPQY